jgi:hypothetical protein
MSAFIGNLALIGVGAVELEIAGDCATECPQAFNKFGSLGRFGDFR